jgi:glutamine amidotransferase
MCRWLAYSGAPIYLDEVVLKPEHSLIDQSLHAERGETTTNGDGFGIGWYGKRDIPGVYKDIQPAWNDSNLRALAAQIESPLFLAHIRAATGTAIQRSNCHPFQYRNWLFMHNGTINGFHAIKRDLVLAISPDLYGELNGTTDSEIMFYLALTFGMADDVAAGMARMTGFVEDVGRSHGIENPMQMSLGISDGRSLFAFRYSSEGRSRTLFHSENIEAIQQVASEAGRFSPDARAIVSEPLSDLAEAWVPVPESSFVTVAAGAVHCEPFAPQAP